MTPAVLAIPVAVLALAAGLGWLGHRHPGGKHVQPARRLTTRRRRALIEEAQTLAWLSRLERHHEISLLAAAQIQAHVTGRLLEHVQPIPPPSGWEPATGPIHATAWQALPPHDGPVPDAMQDDDPRYPHLARMWADSTGSFAKIIEGEK